ncbi:MAG: hypothetical protein BGO49_30570 [Planctomycetales bacterium 71-10]|nr:MAG: hypothetical protein BGO49_30570 [Planctomycetales bacterium 71-10]
MQLLANCPICGSQACRHVYSGRTTRNPDDPSRWDFWRCSTCDHGFLNPQPGWDELDKYYSSNYSAYGKSHGIADSMDATIREARASGVYRHVPIRPGLRILDVGAGGGSFLTVAKALGAHVRGVEPSPFGAQTCRDNGIDVFEGTLEQYAGGGAEDRYDLITFSHVVEHLPDPVATLKLAATLLDVGGYIWLAVPNGACRLARRLEWRWHSTDLPLHLHHFSPRSMRVMSERAGLPLRDLRTFSFPPAVRASILLEWRYLWKVPRRLSGALLTQRFVERQAARMDENEAGEAILAEFAQPAEATTSAPAGTAHA